VKWTAQFRERPTAAARTPAGLAVLAGSDVVCIDPETGKQRWKFRRPSAAGDWVATNPTVMRRPRSRFAETGSPAAGAMLAIADRVLLADGATLIALDANDGTPAWRKPLPGDEDSLPATIAQVGSLACAIREETLVFFDPYDGTELNRLATSAATAGQTPAAAAGTVVALADRNILVGLSERDGKELWRASAPTPSLAPPLIAGDGKSLAAIVDRHLLWRIDPKAGNIAWQIALADKPRFDVGATLGVAGDYLTTRVKGAAELRRISDGAKVWSLPLQIESDSSESYGWRFRDGKFEILGQDRVLGSYDPRGARDQANAASSRRRGAHRLSQGATVWAVADRPR
jgi:outer membrane protein assembly factor BamB